MLRNRELIVHNNPKSPVSEAFRTLRTNIQFSNIDKNVKSIILTSSGPGEGKSTVISNLAITMAQMDKRVLLIDADLRKPRVNKIFGIANTDGLTTVLSEDINYEDVIAYTEIDGVHILTSGPIPPNPAEILGSNKMTDFLEKVKEDYDMVLIDAPPIGVVTDAAVLSTKCDGVLLVCAVGQAMVNAVVNAKELLLKVNANILGVIMNKIPLSDGGYYKYHYYNYYSAYYEDEDNVSKKRKRKKTRRKQTNV